MSTGKATCGSAKKSRGHAVVKFTREGKFLLQIGEVDKTNGSNDTKLLGAPSGIDFDPAANEVYIADGYVNQRIIVFDADTGAYKRHWGRYGLKPDDAFEPGPQPTWLPSPFLVGKPPNMGKFPRFAHGVNISRDGLVYAADRSHSVLHVHRKDGTYVKEAAMPGPFNSVAFSADPEQVLRLCDRDERECQDVHREAKRPAGARVLQERRATLRGCRFKGQLVYVWPVHASEVGAEGSAEEDRRRPLICETVGILLPERGTKG